MDARNDHGVGMRRRLLRATTALVAALAIAAPVAARAQTPVTYPSGIPSGGVVIQNPTGSAVGARMITFGTGFAPGAMPAGHGLTLTIGGTPYAVQMDVHSTWSDGSARWVSVTMPAPALGAGATAAVTLTPTASPAGGSALAWPSPTVTVSGLPGGTTLDLSSALAASTDTWLSGALAVQRRVDVPVPGDVTGTLHLVADVTANSDGTIVGDFQFRRDLTVIQPANGNAQPVGGSAIDLTTVGATASVPLVSGDPDGSPTYGRFTIVGSNADLTKGQTQATFAFDGLVNGTWGPINCVPYVGGVPQAAVTADSAGDGGWRVTMGSATALRVRVTGASAGQNAPTSATVAPDYEIDALSYTPTVSINGNSQGLPTALQSQYQDWHYVLGASPLNVQHDVAGLIAAGLVPPYDLALGVSSAAGSQYADEQAALGSAGFGAPLAINGVTPYMETTGGRSDIGITTAANATWLMTQDDTARRYALAQADAGGGIPWHMWVSANARWADPVDYPSLWTDPRSHAGSYSDYPNYPVPQSPFVPWTIATSHMDNLDYIPALLTGSRFYLDMETGQATGAEVFNYVPNRESSGDVIFGPEEVRLIAWQLRETEEAAALATPGSTTLAHQARVLSDSWAWLAQSAQEPAWTSAQGTLSTYFPDRNAPGMVSPWQQDYFLAALYMAIKLGDPGATTSVAKPMFGTRLQALLPHAGWNRRNGVTYEWFPGTTTISVTPAQGSTAAGPQITNWGDFQNAQVRNGQDNPTSFADTNGDYASLARQSAVLYLDLYPGDATGIAALNWTLGSGAPHMDPATMQNSTMQEAVALPVGISSGGTASSVDPGGYGDTGSATDPGYNAASSGGTSSSGTSSSSGTTSSSTGTAAGAVLTAPSPIAGAVAEYTFNTQTAGVIPDVSGNSNSGTVTSNNVSLGSDSSGSYMSIATTYDYVNLGSSASLTPTTFTLAFLVKPTALANSDDLYGGANGAGNALAFRLVHGVPELDLEGDRIVCTSTGTVTVGTLQSVAVTYDGNACDFYIGGAAAGSTAVGSVTWTPATMTLGGGSDGNDEVKIYRASIFGTALTAQQIATDASVTVSSAGTSSSGTTASVPGSITSLTGTPGVGTLTLSWAGGAGATSYVETITASGGSSVTRTVTSEPDTVSLASGAYTVSVTGVDSAGSGPVSSSIDVEVASSSGTTAACASSMVLSGLVVPTVCGMQAAIAAAVAAALAGH